MRHVLVVANQTLATRDVDEIVISTLPTHLSHGLHTDLPSRVQRRFGVPVTTVTASSAH